jgi:hypothetical protein
LYMVKDTCQDSSLIAAQSLALQDLESSQTTKCLNHNDQKQAKPARNKKVHPTVPKY